MVSFPAPENHKKSLTIDFEKNASTTFARNPQNPPSGPSELDSEKIMEYCDQLDLDETPTSENLRI